MIMEFTPYAIDTKQNKKKKDAIAQLEFELAYYTITVQNVNHYVTRTPLIRKVFTFLFISKEHMFIKWKKKKLLYKIKPKIFQLQQLTSR